MREHMHLRAKLNLQKLCMYELIYVYMVCPLAYYYFVYRDLSWPTTMVPTIHLFKYIFKWKSYNIY
jgi:hypothetical protein